MNFFLETLQFIVLLIYRILESVVFLFVPRPKKNVAGEIVLITGAGSGVGRLLALKFARLGATLVLWDINVEGNKETARLARKIGTVRVHEYTCDCSKRHEVYQVADQVKKEVGDVSILINNAGIVSGSKFLDTADSLIQKTIQVNTMAHFWTVKAFLPAMIASDHGHVVTMASAAGLCGVNGLADYCASKFAVVGFMESLMLEMIAMGKTGVKSTTVCPYFIKTGMFDGCQTKWPTVMPLLDIEYAAEKIMSGILRNEDYILIPRSIFFLILVKSIAPVKIAVLIGKYFGVFSFMDTYRGRTAKTEENTQKAALKVPAPLD